MLDPNAGADRDPAARAVLRAAEQRAQALAAGDATTLRALLHPEFGWTSHTGQRFDREAYVRRNAGGAVRWHRQELSQVSIRLAGSTAVLWADVTDVVDTGTFHMPMTPVWVRTEIGWQLLTGHAGPRRAGGAGDSADE